MTNNELGEIALSQVGNCGMCAHRHRDRCENDDLVVVTDPASGESYVWSCHYFFSDCLDVAVWGLASKSGCHATTLANLPCPGFRRRDDL